MNKTRRKRIQDIIDQLEGLKSEIEELQAKEQDSFDAIPENMQQSERAEKSETAINELEEAADNIQNAIDNLQTSIE